MPLLPQSTNLPAGSSTPTSGAADQASFYDNFLSTMFMAPGATGMKLPLLPSQPMISGLPGMAARRGNYFGPHWDTQVARPAHVFSRLSPPTAHAPRAHSQVQARATAAAESLINSAQLLPQNSAHPNYPPGFPLRFGFSSTYPQVAAVMNGGASWV
jgi:hypothetical protein